MRLKTFRLSISGKIITLIGVAVVANLSVAATYWYSRSIAASAYEAREVVERASAAISDLRIEVAIIHALEQRFFIDRSAKSAAGFNQARGKLAQDLAALGTFESLLGSRSVKDILSFFATYTAAIGAAVEAQRTLGFSDEMAVELQAGGGIKENNGLTARISNQILSVRKRLGDEMEFSDSPALYRMASLLAEIAERQAKLVTFSSPEYADDIFKRLDSADALLKTDGLDSSFVEQVKAGLKEYRSLVATWSQAHVVLAGKIASVAPAYERLTAGLIAANTAISNHLKEAATTFARLRSLSDRAIVVAILASLAFILIYGFLSGRDLIGLLRRLTADMRRLAAGDLAIEVASRDRTDEIGEMARAVIVFRDAAIEKRSLEGEAAEQRKLVEDQRVAAEEQRRQNEEAQEAAAEQQAAVVSAIAASLAKLSGGDLTHRLEAAFPPAYQRLKDDFNGAMDQLQQAMLSIVRAADEIRSGTIEFTRATDDLSKRTEQQAASLEETAAAVEEITATVGKTAESANHAKTLVAKAGDAAERSGSVMRNAVEAMTAIEGSAKQIAQIIGAIDEIAFQTNLLALNAGVEAARAGEAGKGFAVVATEVRSLAQRTANAAKEIETLILSSAAQVDNGVKLVSDSGEALGKILAEVAEVREVVVEIAGSAHEQATGLEQVNKAVIHIDQMTQQNAAMVDQSTTASHTLASEAKTLAELVSQFKVGTVTAAADGARAVRSRTEPGKEPVHASLAAVDGRPFLKVARQRTVLR